MKKNLLKGSILELVVDMEQDSEILQLLRLVRKFDPIKSHKIMITVKPSLQDFNVRLGEVITSQTKFKMDIPKDVFTLGDDSDISEMYGMIGAVTLNTYITKTFFVKSEADQKVYEMRGNDESKIDK